MTYQLCLLALPCWRHWTQPSILITVHGNCSALVLQNSISGMLAVEDSSTLINLPASSESDSVHSTHYSQVPTMTNHSTTVGWNKWNKTSAMNSRATRLFHILVISSHNLPQIICITMTSVELYKKLSCQTQPHSIQCLHSHWSV